MEGQPLPEKKLDQSRARGKGPQENRGYFVEGTVLRSVRGIYSYSVETVNKEVLACKNATTMVADIIGVKDLSTLTVGTAVMVWIPSKNSSKGVIICAIPGHKSGTGKITPRQFSADPESGSALFSEEYFKTMVQDKKFNQKLFAQAGRPYDINPGDWAKINEHGVFLGILGLTAAMRGSQNCAIEVHTLDDLLRLRSGQYQHFTAFGEHHIYNDGGEISVEICGSSRQHEVSGQDSIGQEIFTEEEEANNNYKDLHVKPADAEAAVKRRFQMFFGHLGLMQLFACKPETGPETASREANHQGLLHMNVGDNGYFSVTAAAGMALTRDDIIPIPKKKKEPWDPSGDKPETESVAQPKEGYEIPEGFEGGTHLLARDIAAWARRQSYQRFDELENDWHVPEADDMSTPDNNYDTTSGGAQSTENFEPNTEKRAGIYWGPDGSITMMDAAGTQFVMDGRGDVRIGGAGNIILMPGTNVIMMAGDDVIMKAKNSIDITSTDKDVRLKAENNMQMYSNGGILLESNGESIGHGYSDDNVGEENVTSGVVIKSRSRVFIWAQDVFVSGIRSAAIEVLEGASRGIQLIADTIKGVANTIRMTANGKAQLDLSEGGNATVSAEGGAVLAGQRSVGVFQGKDLWIPLDKKETYDPAEIQLNQGRRDKAVEFDSPRAWMGQYNPEERGPIQFTFRNEAQYATNDFELYQLSWQVLIDQSPRSLQDVGITASDNWQEVEVNGTMPFPGIEKISSDVYIVLSDVEKNVDENGRMKTRSEMVNTAEFNKTSLNEYKVRKR